MKNRTARSPTVILVLMFIVGFLAFVLPIVTELSSYQADDEEYEELAAQYQLPTSTPHPSLLPQRTASKPTDTAQTKESNAFPMADETDPPNEEHYVAVTPTSSPESIAKSEPELIPPPVRTEPDSDDQETPQEKRQTDKPVLSPEPSSTPQSQTGIDLEACLAENKDFVAWLSIPGTKINSPVVRSDNTAYYLRHLFSGKESKLGSLFSLKSSDYQTPSKNITIYGHHLSNSDAMFSTLLNYKRKSYYSDHSLIYLDTLYGSRSYRIFAVVDMLVSEWDASAASFSSSNAFMRFVNRAVKQSLYETGVNVDAEDNILTLITCDRSYGGAAGRLLVMAVELQ